jgi:PIN domain nuclease of toxin-antitoxin system
VIVLDTHAWVWFLADPARLSRAARAAIDAAMAEEAVAVSSMSCWEVAMLASRGRLQFTIPAAEWLAKATALPVFMFVPIDNEIAVEAVGLPSSVHPDPADRFIVATARSLGAALVTKDARLRRCGQVACVW